MESCRSHSHNKPKACYETESRSKNQPKEVTVPPGMRGGNESFLVKSGGKSVDPPMQAQTPTSTVTPSTATTLAPASATASPATSRTLFGPAATRSLISSTVILTNKIPDKQGVGITEGTTLASGASEPKTKCSREAELETSDKNFFKNINKPTSQISASTDLQKTLQITPPAIGTTRTALPKATSSIQVACTLKGREIPLQLVPECPLFPLDRSLGATTTLISADGTDKNATAQERECEREKRKEWKEGMRKDGREALEKRGEHERKGQEKKTEGATEKERKGQDRNIDIKEEDMIERENKSDQNLKNFKNAAVVTKESPVPVQTLDAALQTEPSYKDTEIQAVVEVSNKSTSMSPIMTCHSWSHMDPTLTLSNHEKVPETAHVSLQNGQDVSLDSGLAPAGPVAKRLSPTHYTPSMSKSPRQHVCQIQIELCSQSVLSDSLALPEEKDPEASSTRSELEKEPKQVNSKGDQAQTSPLPEVAWDEQGMTWEVYGAAVDMESLGFAIQNHLQCKIREHEQRIRHLRKSISVSEHSNGDVKGAKKKRKHKKKRNVFRSLFQRPTSCFKTESEA